jgi:hypothetical protein
MALVLSRRNGAPLGGALFVSNPRNRKNRRNAAKKRRRAAPKRRRAAPKRRNMAHAKRSAAAKKAAATRRRNALKRSRAAKKGAATRRRNARKGTRKGMVRKTARRAYSKARKTARRVTPKRRRNALAVRVNRRNRRNRRNASYIKLSNRRNRRNALAVRVNRRNRRNRRNTATVASFKLSGIAQKVYAPVARLLKKIPYVGKPVAAALPTGIYIVAGMAAHHYVARPLVSMAYSYVPMAVQNAVAPVARFIAPAQSFLTGVLVAALLQNKRIPLNPATKKQLAVALIGAGAAIDTMRYYSGGDLSGAMTLPGYGNAMTIPGYGAIGMELGDGGAYDVIPMGALAAEYSGAHAVDAAACPADLSVEEGEAALNGPGYWRKYFGPPPVRMATAGRDPHSNLVGRPGHRWGWLIKMIGFERFSKLASISPDARVQLLANLKAQAIQMADAQIAQSSASTVPDTGALAMDMNGVLFAGSM